MEEILTRMCWKGLSKARVFPTGMLEEEVLGLVVYVVGWCVEQCPCQNLRNRVFKTSQITITHVIPLVF